MTAGKCLPVRRITFSWGGRWTSTWGRMRLVISCSKHGSGVDLYIIRGIAANHILSNFSPIYPLINILRHMNLFLPPSEIAWKWWSHPFPPWRESRHLWGQSAWDEQPAFCTIWWTYELHCSAATSVITMNTDTIEILYRYLFIGNHIFYILYGYRIDLWV